MSKYQIIRLNEFKKQFNKLSKDIQNRFRKQMLRLKENPDQIGKPLGCPWLRELKNDKFRAYYLICKNPNQIMMIRLSDKKDQKEAIDFCKERRSSLRFIARETESYLYYNGRIRNMEDNIGELIRERNRLADQVAEVLEKIERINTQNERD